ncbi:hypothetical protein ACFX15_039134 [Malus domestica]
MNTRGDGVPCRPRTVVLGGVSTISLALRHAFLENHSQSYNWTHVEIARSHGVSDLKVVETSKEAEDWLEKIDDVFYVMHCPKEERALTAGHLLWGDAKIWWD